jgi:hypothetical protein
MWFQKKRRPISRSVTSSNLFTKILLIILVVSILGFIFFTIQIGALRVKKLDITLKNIKCTTAIKIADQIKITNKNILFIQEKLVQENLKNHFICINQVKLTKNIPSRINLEVLGREAVAQILSLPKQDSTSSAILNRFLEKEATTSAEEKPTEENVLKFFLVDDEGIIFSEEQVNNKPRLYVWDEIKIGQKIEKNIVSNGLDIIKKVEILNIKIAEAKIYSNRYLLIDSKPKLIFDLSDNTNKQLGSLQLILSRAKIDNEEMEFIDLRFENPVVKYLPKKGEN